MKTLTNLTARLSETDFREPPVHHHHIGITHAVKTTDGRDGFYSRFMRVGPAGIIFSNGKASLVVPADELWKLAESHEPDLAIPEKIEVPTNAGKKDPEPRK